jgi:hypothetical protein
METVIKVGTTPGDPTSYRDGDVVCCFSDFSIHLCHAEMICHPRKFSFNGDGLRERKTLLEKFTARSSLFRFTRVSTEVVQRENLSTSNSDLLTSEANSQGEYIDVGLYIQLRRQSSTHKIFGATGQEVWYGGVRRNSETVFGAWSDIENDTDYRQVDHFHWPLSDAEKRNFLPLNYVGWRGGKVCEVSGGTASERCCAVCEPDVVEEDGTEEEGEMLAKRKWQVPYWDLASSLGISVDDVRDKTHEVDARSDAPESERNKMDDIHIDKVEAGILV